MSETTFRAMGTEWYVRADGCSPAVLLRARTKVHREERRFSRFRADSAVSTLNNRRTLREPTVAAVLRDAMCFWRWTRGAFDPTVGAAVVAAGYDRSFEELSGRQADVPPPRHSLQVSTTGPHISLSGEGDVDLGGIVKGWAVDEVARILESAGATGYLVDGGGDIRVSGAPADATEWTIGVADHYTIGLQSGAVATSSSLRRRWETAAGSAHHIITPNTGRPAEGPYVTAVVVAADTETADVLGTALIADAIRVLPLLARLKADAMLLDDAGAWSMTPGMERWLRP